MIFSKHFRHSLFSAGNLGCERVNLSVDDVVRLILGSSTDIGSTGKGLILPGPAHEARK